MVFGFACACSQSQGEPRGGYDCSTACDHALNTCGMVDEYVDVQQCTTTCGTDAWAENFIECRSTTCDSDEHCRNWTVNEG